MPNWVYNNIQVTGTIEQVKSFIAKAERPRQWLEDTLDSDNGYSFGEQRFSYANFVPLPADHLAEYFEPNGWTKDVTTGEMVHTGQTEYNWYNWNIDNWGCKWDAGEIETDYNEYPNQKDIAWVSYSFTSPWGMPMPVFQAMTEQHPELHFSFEWEEEQGWGGAADGRDGVLTITADYDIPTSHADYANRDNLDGCMCNHYTDESDWYADCPREEEEVLV